MTAKYRPLNQRDRADRLLRQAYQAHQARRPREAESLYRQLLEIAPADVEGCNLLGLLYLETDRPADAARMIRRGLELRPDDSQAQYNLGIALMKLGDTGAARDAFSAAVKLAPQNADALSALGNVERQLGELEDAAEHFRRALAISDVHVAARKGLADTLNDLGVQHNQSGRSEAALELFREATRVEERNAHAQINLGILLEQVGQPDQAARAFQAAIAARPQFADAHFQLAHLHDHESTDEEIATMEKLFGSARGNKDKALLAFGLAKAFQKRTDPNREFEWLARAHDVKRIDRTYDIDRTRRSFDAVKKQFRARSKTAGRGRGIVFVIGMPRSGTTLTEQILASHASVFGAGETGIIAAAARRYRSAHDLERLALQCEDRLLGLADNAQHVVETTPANFQYSGLIAEILPESRVVHCRRNPLDTCLSIYQHPLSDAHAYAHTFENLAAYHRLYQDLMDHWQRAIPEMIFELQYEDLVNDFEKTVRSLLEFCGLEFDAACLEFHRTPRVVRTPSASQVRRPIYTDSVGRWRRYEPQLAPLIQLLHD